MVLDHVFVLPRGSAHDDRALDIRTAEAADGFVSRLHDAGFLIGSSRSHPGQGTSNRRCFLDDLMIECLVVDDEDALDDPRGAVLRLGTRFRNDAASALGFAFRPDGTDSAAADFSAVAYRPRYLPPAWHIDVHDEPDTRMPLLFHLPFAARAHGAPDDAEPRAHPNGARRVSELHLESECDPARDALRVLAEAGVRCTSGPECLHVRLDGMQGALDLRPSFPLRLHA